MLGCRAVCVYATEQSCPVWCHAVLCCAVLCCARLVPLWARTRECRPSPIPVRDAVLCCAMLSCVPYLPLCASAMLCPSTAPVCLVTRERVPYLSLQAALGAKPSLGRAHTVIDTSRAVMNRRRVCTRHNQQCQKVDATAGYCSDLKLVDFCHIRRVCTRRNPNYITALLSRHNVKTHAH
jgi:hypothetical protein